MSLALATSAIDVHPPRAGRWSRNVPQFWRLKWAWGKFGLAFLRPLNDYFARFDDTNFDLSTMVRLVVPGWASWYRGRSARGLLFFASFIGFLVTGLVLLGTGLGSVLVGLAFGVHVASAVDATVGRFADFSSRLLFTLGCALALLALVYLPIGMWIGRHATPIRITQPIGDFQAGDVLWYDASSEVAPGQWVYYRVPQTTVAGRTEQGQAANFVFQNQWINRVLAVGGQTVTTDGKQIFVDGTPVSWQGRLPFGLDGSAPLVVPAGKVLIPPELLVEGNVSFTAATWQNLSLVPRADVHGHVYFRSLPLSRFDWLD